MSKKLIIAGGKYITRGGLKVRVLASDVAEAGGYPVVALVTSLSGGENVQYYTPEGRFFSSGEEHSHDLIDRDEKVCWSNVYADARMGGTYETAHTAREGRGSNCVGQLKTTIINGGSPAFDFYPA